VRRDDLKRLLANVRAGRTSVKDALARLDGPPFEDIGFAKVDAHRELRCGFPEVVYCAGKTPAEVQSIAERLLARSERLLATRAGPEHAEALARRFKEALFHPRAGIVTIRRGRAPRPRGFVLVLSAGTADIPVAEEALLTAAMMDARVEPIYDVGVAGVHRLLHHGKKLRSARVLVVAAGMDGALPSVVGGLVGRPVIAVPTSVGYGASFGGVAALLTMLNSCAAGVAVVNIDNGFGAGYLAALINDAG